MKSISYYQASIFLSSDFFSDYWSSIIGDTFNEKDSELIKLEFRKIVLNIMNGEKVFWDIDFSEKAITSIENLVGNLVENKFKHLLSPLKLIFNTFDKESAEANMILSFLYRIATDMQFCIDEHISSKTHECISLCIDETKENKIDLFNFYDLWQNAESEWDSYIKSITPDEPNYICDIYISVYQSNMTLPNIFNSLEDISTDKEKNDCLHEIKSAMLNYYSSDTIVNEAVKLIPIV